MYIPICVNCLYSIVKFRVHVAGGPRATESHREGEGRPAARLSLWSGVFRQTSPASYVWENRALL